MCVKLTSVNNVAGVNDRPRFLLVFAIRPRTRASALSGVLQRKTYAPAIISLPPAAPCSSMVVLLEHARARSQLRPVALFSLHVSAQ